MNRLEVGIYPEQLQKATVWYEFHDAGVGGRRAKGYARRTPGSAYVASVSATERRSLGQYQHPITHNVVFTASLPSARPGDYFLIDSRRYYVRGVEDPGNLGLVALFRCEERPDRDE